MGKNLDLVNFADSKLGCIYSWGARGQTISESYIQSCIKQYGTSRFTASRVAMLRKNIGKQAYDCHGLIKSFVMGSQYVASLDITIKTAYNNAVKKGTISTLPKNVGGVALFVVKNDSFDHIGLTDGKGNAIEAKDWNAGVIKRPLSAGSWTHWAYYKGIDYAAVNFDVISAARFLQERGVIDNADYWVQQSKVVRWLDSFIVKTATAIANM